MYSILLHVYKHTNQGLYDQTVKCSILGRQPDVKNESFKPGILCCKTLNNRRRAISVTYVNQKC